MIRPIRHKAALIDKFLLWIDCRQTLFDGKLDDALSFGEKGGTGIIVIAPTCFCFAL